MKQRGQSGLFYGISFILFLILSVWFFVLHIRGEVTEHSLEVFAGVYGVMALCGGLIGLHISRKWGGFSSLLGKSIGFFSLGLLAQEFGQLSYSYYSVVLGVNVPYPSVGDLGFFGSIPLYTLGVYYLMRICLAWIGSNVTESRLKLDKRAFVIPLLLLLATYLFLLRGYEVDTDNIFGTVLDFAYPLFQACYVSLALVCFYYTKSIYNSIMHRGVIFLLGALVAQYFADFLFLYKAYRGIYTTGGVTDYCYLTAYFLMTIALIYMGDVFERTKNDKVAISSKVVN